MRKNDDNPLSVNAIAALGDGACPVGALPPTIRLAEMIIGLKERLVGLHGQTNDARTLFRLSYSILSLETCLEEKGLLQMSLDKAPAIRSIIRQIDDDISTLARQAVTTTPSLFGAIAHLTRQLTETGYGVAALTDTPEMVRMMTDLQKTITADGRRHYASQAALHASIERLSERLGQMEARLVPPVEETNQGSSVHETASRMTREPSPIDPRPMLKAARAAAARALTDIENAPVSSTLPSLGAPPLDQPPLRRRRWSFSFAAA